MERFAATPLPTGAEDAWRYSRIGELDLARFAPVLEAPDPSAAQPGVLPAAARHLLDSFEERSGLVVTLDGFPAVAELSEAAAAAGVRLGGASGASGEADLVGSVESEFPPTVDGFGSLADAFAPDTCVLRVPAGLDLLHPVFLVHVVGSTARKADGAVPAVFPRTLVRLDENAGAEVVELVVSAAGAPACLVLPTVELSVAEGARLSHDLVQQLDGTAWQIARLAAAAGRDATLRSFQASLGGGYARMETDSVLTGQGGSAQLLAAYFGDGEQVHDFRTLQEHAAPRTTSDLVFKGAVAGTARSVYNGLIRMRHGAKGANAFQTNRNLVLSDGAHADSVPNLDIQENDVRCSHASAVGPIDEEQRFYLEARGVPRKVAERLILLGFFSELLDRVDARVGRQVLAAIAERVQAVAA